MTRVAFVVQRYGTEVIGGAELYARQLAEALATKLGWEIDVYTSCASSYQTWANTYPAGETRLGNVRVWRFRSILPRLGPVFSFLHRACIVAGRWRLPRPLRALLEALWVRAQGPWTPSLVRTLRKRLPSYQRVFFVTYLYYPTLVGWRVAGAKAALVPTAHDEPPFYFTNVQRMLAGLPQLLALTEAERDLLRSQLPAASRDKVAMLGYGLAAPPAPQPPQRDKPYVLYLGRISAGKRVDLLLAWFLDYCATRPSNATLVLAGELEATLELPRSPHIRYAGRVSDAEKDALLAGALGVINPSPYESLSLLVVEAMLLGRPALVDATSPVLRFYTENTATVLPYAEREGFFKGLDRLLAMGKALACGEEAATTACATTRKWAVERFSWDRVLNEVSGLVT